MAVKLGWLLAMLLLVSVMVNRGPVLADEEVIIHGAQRAWIGPSQKAASSKAARNNIVLRMARFHCEGKDVDQACLADA
ncbi:hypothetical protein [Aquitalea sp. ASV11]|uniref:hypothetical protein n=1 Tax=Aquitalea sp. ASV11 TaxID=2795103 RepID=UPI0018EA8E7D|nr:hypothetical protein [Aquitalea sp. ASV11]